jgi:PAS domain S-box-containing protein
MVKDKFTDEELRVSGENSEGLGGYTDRLSKFLHPPVFIINPSNIVVGTNRAFQKLTGYSETEAVGKPLAEFFLERKEVENVVNEVQNGELAVEKELTLISKQEKEVPVSISVVTRKDEENKFAGYFVSLADVAEIKKLRQELEKKVGTRTKDLEESRKALLSILEDVEDSRKTLVNILEDVEAERRRAEGERDKTLAVITNFADGLLLFDAENKLSLINPQAEKFFEIEGEKIIGKSLSDLGPFPAFKSLTDLVGEEIKDVFRKEAEVKKNLVLEISTVPMLAEKEKTGSLIILHDITREKLVEKMKTEFVSLAAHQLRTPLSAIKWTLRMLLDGDLGEINEEQKNFIEKTYKSNEIMISLINDLLDITRIEEGKYLHKPVLTEMEPVVQFVVDSYKEEFEKKKLEFEFKKPENKLPQVMLDVEKMRLVVQNFLDNALKYTPPGGKVTVSLKSDEKEVEFSIVDTGVGIPKDQQERMFTKFFRGINVIRMETEGSGLGIFITKNIVEAHGGKIWFESEEGKGTTFHFTVPVTKQPAESKESQISG